MFNVRRTSKIIEIERKLEERAEAAVKKGAALLDKHRPGWEDAIKPQELRMSDGSQCILGQVFRQDEDDDDYRSGYDIGTLELTINSEGAFEMGFLEPVGDDFLTEDEQDAVDVFESKSYSDHHDGEKPRWNFDHVYYAYLAKAWRRLLTERGKDANHTPMTRLIEIESGRN